ncbi:MAG TPA: M1 family metallopeptidase [Polyangia bacterium]|jgi:puromycin-sensitive aminopeptidase|nr:M1 family metallopeptidase [Polyangia bacterium]
MGDKNFRLSPAIRPERYRFTVAPDLGSDTFTGRGSIELVLDRPAREITLHGVHLTVTAARLGAPGHLHPVRWSTDADSQTITFTDDSAGPGGAELAAGPAVLEIEWSGVFQKDLRGLYRAGGMAVTQFEAADARRVFPCFDEPPFKAAWEVAIETVPGLSVLSNGAVVSDETHGTRRLVKFAPTPRMSSYLVALIVGQLQASAEKIVRNVPIRTWSVPDKIHLTGFAQDCAAAVLPLLEDYFARPYVFGKLDQIGIPDFEAGAMENSGCITFREIALLVDPAKAPLNIQKRVAEVITHELAHQWFGNLVTMCWWDDLWLNEAFATWMAYKIGDVWRPAWRMWDDFEQGKAAALHLDSLESTHPIRGEVRNADEATENFDLITYEKGGAMLRMIEGYLGEAAFREGIRAYMRDHAFKNTVANDLWRALAQSSQQPVEALANGWIGRPGYPLVELRREGNHVKLRQRRFYADPARFRAAAEAEPPWLVPVVLRFADDAGVHEARMLLGDREGEVTLPARGEVKFVCGNQNGAGFYRVRYEPAELAALARHSAQLSAVERVNLVADAWALFRADAAPLAPLIDLLVSLASDRDYTVLGEVVSRLDALERRFAAPGDRSKVRRIVESLLLPQLGEVGWDVAPGEEDGVRLRRAALVRGLGLVARAPSVLAEARARLERSWRGEAGALDANLLDAATVATARAGDAAMFDELVRMKERDPDPAAKRRCLVALASFESSPLIERAVNLILDPVVPMQDITTYVGALLSNGTARAAAWDYLRAQWPKVHEKSAAPMLTRRMVESLGELTDRRAEVEAFFTAQAAAFAAVPQAVNQTRERLRLDEEVHARATRALSDWLKARPEPR